MTGVLTKRKSLDIDMQTKRTPCEDQGGDQDDTSAKQGMPHIAGKPAEMRREAWDRPPQSFPKEPALPTS